MEPDVPDPGSPPTTGPHAPDRRTWDQSDRGDGRDIAEEVAAFYRFAAPRIIAVLIKKGAAPAEASEAAHEALTRAARKWRTITTNPMSWCITTAERYYWERTYSANASYDDIPPDSPLLQDPTADVVERVAARLQLEHVRDRLRSLTTRQRAILDLHLAGLGSADIAEQLMIASPTVRVHLAAIRRILDSPASTNRPEKGDR